MNNEKLRDVVKENFEIAKNNFYISKNGNKVELDNKVKDMIEKTELVNDEVTYVENYKEIQKNYIVRDNIINLGTIDTILKLRNEGVRGNIIALNFASAINPGGGYLSGSKAQEESLCRASMLYESLKKQNDFYKFNRENYTPLYNDRMLYVPNVPIIRNDTLELLDNYELASFIVSPAVNRRKAYSEGIRDEKLIVDIMSKRIEKIVKLAISRKPTVLILGAFGCGVFGNDREVVYDIFEKCIREFVPVEIKVIFAVIQ